MKSGGCSKSPRAIAASELITWVSSVGSPRRKHYYRDLVPPRAGSAIRQGLGQPSGTPHPGGRLVAGGGRQPGGGEPAAPRPHQSRPGQFLGPAACWGRTSKRGGVFAQIIGTLALLAARERPLIGGIPDQTPVPRPALPVR